MGRPALLPCHPLEAARSHGPHYGADKPSMLIALGFCLMRYRGLLRLTMDYLDAGFCQSPSGAQEEKDKAGDSHLGACYCSLLREQIRQSLPQTLAPGR